MEVVADIACFGGRQLRLSHHSTSLKCDMHFSLFLPPGASENGSDRSSDHSSDKSNSIPMLTWLSGLTCTDENFVQKAGAQRVAAALGVAVLAPDTSPRGEEVPDDEDGAWDMGLGAGFYVNATQEPWSANYQMYDYVVDELPAVVAEHYAVDLSRHAISGHSMGGHGALTIALRNPDRYTSVSALAPICSPLHCPWGHKALSAYLGADRSAWAQHDSCELIRATVPAMPMLVDQGTADSFLEEQLKTHLLESALRDSGCKATVRMQEGYDHSYFFISSFIEDHLSFHAQYWR
ncbi:MAG: S-formylglutathione hydrolase [Congregibacter sp.]